MKKTLIFFWILMNSFQLVQASSLDKLKNNADSVTGIEVIIADSGPELMSRFGHAFIRLLDNDKSPFNDVTVSFVANIDTQQQSKFSLYSKGVTGGFPMVVDVSNFSAFWLRYTSVESRPLKRIIIPTTKEQRKKIVGNIIRYHESPKELSGYTFFTNNCAIGLAHLFSESSLPVAEIVISGRVPVLFTDWLRYSTLSFLPEVDIKSPISVYMKIQEIFKIDNAKDVTQWPEDAVEILKRKLSRNDLRMLHQDFINIPQALADYVVNHLSYADRAERLSIFGLQEFSKDFYDVCEDEQCLESYFMALESSFPEKDIIKLRKSYSRVYDTLFKVKKPGVRNKVSGLKVVRTSRNRTHRSDEFRDKMFLFLYDKLHL